MPYIKIQTNKSVNNQQEILKRLSALSAELLNKPEQYIMTAFENSEMTFAGTSEPAMFVEVKSIGLDSSKTDDITKSLCEFFENEVGVCKDRINIEFSNAVGSMWGWNSKTFR